jgi:hypothetical protein
MLEQIWVRDCTLGVGTFYIVSGFANYNGGVRFYDLFKKHINLGGNVKVIFGGSTSQRLASKQVVEELLSVGAEVHIINRKRILHAKCYGSSSPNGQNLVLSSGNFTGPGMSQNVEASLMLDKDLVRNSGFSWDNLLSSIFQQKWDFYKPDLNTENDPSWSLLYDETASDIRLDDTQEVSLIITLSNADTARIQAAPNTTAAKGTQYFWLSKDSYDFFPPLTIRNSRGIKATYSAIIKMNYLDLGIIDEECRVTFEAENNFDFRLGTGKFRYTKIAEKDDLAVIKRLSEDEYSIKIVNKDSIEYDVLRLYAINFIGHQGKKYGYIDNQELNKLINDNNFLSLSGLLS